MGQKLSCNNLSVFLPKRFILFLLLLQHDIFIDFIHVAGIGLWIIGNEAITAIYIPLFTIPLIPQHYSLTLFISA